MKPMAIFEALQLGRRLSLLSGPSLVAQFRHCLSIHLDSSQRPRCSPALSTVQPQRSELACKPASVCKILLVIVADVVKKSQLGATDDCLIIGWIPRISSMVILGPSSGDIMADVVPLRPNQSSAIAAAAALHITLHEH